MLNWQLSAVQFYPCSYLYSVYGIFPYILIFYLYTDTQFTVFETISFFCFTECSPSQPCQGFGPHAHFRDFGTAMLTLFRIATGDNWNGILEVRK